MNGLAASRPSATTSSVGAGALALVLDEVDGGLGGLGLDHHDRDVVTDDTTGDDHVEGRVARSVVVGKATQRPSISATRTPPIGPLNGRPDSWVDIEAALMASTSYWWSGFSA
jgi:hypothetical protein